MKAPSILIVPACERGRGGGHLSRSLLLLKSLKVKGFEAYLWIPEYLKDDFLMRFEDFFEALGKARILSRPEELKDRTFCFIVLDRYRTNSREFRFWSGIGPLIGIDEGGSCRRYFDYLLDLLPGIYKSEPNISAPRLLPLPQNRRSVNCGAENGENPAKVPLRVLISFGAEDFSGLGILTASALSRSMVKGGQNTAEVDITLIAPVPPHDSTGMAEELPGIRVLGRISNLREHLAGFDLLVTHFGLQAFEAIYARLPVLIISPTAYHEKLSRNAGFLSLGIGGRAASRLKLEHLTGGLFEKLKIKREETERRFGLQADQAEDLGDFVSRFSIHSPRACPVCGRQALPAVLARFAGLTYKRCPRCASIYQCRLFAPLPSYNDTYFFENYKKQYGKTYIEDFPNLKALGKRRMELIKKYHIKTQGEKGRDKPSLLDIGCAFGPFMAAAAEAGFAPEGIEPIEEAARHVREKLGLPCRQGFFHGAESGEPQANYDAVTLWYVIEHFKEPGKMLFEINKLLADGGVLAFSSPSSRGISARKSLVPFLKTSPEDHFTIWNPFFCAKILHQYGFEAKKIIITGHHPERFPFYFIKISKILLLLSRLFGLGDTFEVYAVKKRSLAFFPQ